eukprot:6085823-Amphidinium_carterae.1
MAAADSGHIWAVETLIALGAAPCPSQDTFNKTDHLHRQDGEGLNPHRVLLIFAMTLGFRTWRRADEKGAEAQEWQTQRQSTHLHSTIPPFSIISRSK